jgi:D-aminoacyl-tRNA deacylase
MNCEVAIVCTTADPASLNIARSLLDLTAWEDQGGYRSSGHNRLFIHDQRQTALHGLEGRLEELGLKPGLVVFPCRHVAKVDIPWLGGHYTGEIAPDDGRERRLSAASPSGLRSFLHNVAKEAPEGFRVSAEATHHGPTDLTTPSFFAEIGSSEKQWSDPQAGELVARSILGLEAGVLPVFLGIGGGHYVPRQTSLMLNAKISFGHMFSSYQVESLDLNILEEAREKSGASYAYLDRKSLRSENKNRILKILEEMDLPVLRSKEIRARFPNEEQSDA